MRFIIERRTWWNKMEEEYCNYHKSGKKCVHQTEHTAIIGKKGTGKTTLARYLIEQYLNESMWIRGVWSNTSILLRDPSDGHGIESKFFHKFTFLKMLEKADHDIVFVDELSKAIPSRRVGHNSTELYNLIQEVMNRLRKKNCPFIYTDQWRRGADIMVRTNVDHLFNPALTYDDISRKGGETPLFYFAYQPSNTEFWELENPAQKGTLLKTERMMLKDIFPLFRTEEVIKLTYNQPFEVDKWTKGFLLWCAKHNYDTGVLKPGSLRNAIDLYQIKTQQYITSKEQSGVIGKLTLEYKIGGTK